MSEIPHVRRVLLESSIVSKCEQMRTDEYDYQTYYNFIDLLYQTIRTLGRRIEVTKQRIEDEKEPD